MGKVTEETKEQILKKYISLARKLSKLPSQRETVKYICSSGKIISQFKSLSALRKAALEAAPELEAVVMPAQLWMTDVEAYRLGLETKKRKNENKTFIKDVSTLEYISRFSENVFNAKVSPVRPPKQREPIKRVFNLTLSDLHFGADIDEAETGYQSFGRVEEARRFAAVIKETINYKPQYRNHTELHVNLLGDIIQHKLHDSQDAAPMAEQICRAVHLLIQGFAQLAENFISVHVHCATGNHGRDLSRHHSRATSGKWDSIETVIYYSVKKALSQYKNIEFDIPKTPFVIYEVFGHKVFATHGDNVLSPGNPGKSINIGRIEDQINRFNASIEDKEEIKVAVVGHTHCASLSLLSSGAQLVTNGCLPPVDAFAVSIGILENKASQTLFEMTPDYPLGDIRMIRVGIDEDRDESLDEIIEPWENF